MRYDDEPYPGIILQLEENNVKVKCMHGNGVNKFFWPSPRDDVNWYSDEQIMCLIPEQQFWEFIMGKLEVKKVAMNCKLFQSLQGYSRSKEAELDRARREEEEKDTGVLKSTLSRRGGTVSANASQHEYMSIGKHTGVSVVYEVTTSPKDRKCTAASYLSIAAGVAIPPRGTLVSSASEAADPCFAGACVLKIGFDKGCFVASSQERQAAAKDVTASRKFESKLHVENDTDIAQGDRPGKKLSFCGSKNEVLKSRMAWGRNDLLSLSVEQDSDNSLSLKLLLCLEMALCSG
ncbi:hypothetical protein L3Q82_008297 [Scortum barcoo]|uniref:Uncharacterized protein n=1 Tax=Scortum barcoo TaxID=214431 RepID=A0ACB8WHJ5_9TELE|nr:hypothetical protein L3Q82_008297 [Scortum barcoo]